MRRIVLGGATIVVVLFTLVGCAVERPTPAVTAGSSPAQEPSSGCVPEGSPASQDGRQGPGAPPPPSPVPPNAGRVVAQVVKRVVWAPGTLRTARPPITSDQTFVSLSLSIISSAQQEPGRQNLVVPGSSVDAFSCSDLGPEFTGKRIEGVLTLTGDTRGTRWWLTNVRVLP